MRRKAWVMIRNGELANFWYLGDVITPEAFWKPEEVVVAGPFNVEAPPPPTDMIPISYTEGLVQTHCTACHFPSNRCTCLGGPRR